VSSIRTGEKEERDRTDVFYEGSFEKLITERVSNDDNIRRDKRKLTEVMMVDFPTPSERNGEERERGREEGRRSASTFLSSSSFLREIESEYIIFTHHLLPVGLARLFALFRWRLG